MAFTSIDISKVVARASLGNMLQCGYIYFLNSSQRSTLTEVLAGPSPVLSHQDEGVLIDMIRGCSKERV